MKIETFRSVLTASLLAASAAGAVFAFIPAAQAADKEPQMNSSVQKALLAAQTAAQKKDFATALDNVKKAQAVSGQSPFDTYKINQFLTFVAANMGDNATAETAAEGAADSPAMPAADKISVTNNAMLLSEIEKHYDKSAIYAKTLLDAGVTDTKSLSEMAQAFYLGGDYPNSEAVAQKAIDATPAGQKADRRLLEFIMNAQVKLKDEPGAENTLETLAENYNDPADWGQLVDVAMSAKGLRDLDAIYLGRLLFVSSAPVSDMDANLIATTASHLTFYGDVAAATAKGATPVAGNDAKAAADQKTMSAQIAAGSSQGGQYNVKLAEALYSYGNYADAETAARAAIAKGGATDSSEPPMVLGMALVGEGKYADAIQAFKQVSGGGPATARIARMWTGFAQFKAAPAPTASAAPATAPK